MRSKEEAHDYRYFPEPDLPPVRVDEALVARVRGSLPELPRARAGRYQRELGLSPQDASVLVGDGALAGFFDAALAARGGGAEAAKKVANWVIGELSRLMNETGLAPGAWKLTPAGLAEVLGLLEAGTVNGAGAKLLVEELFRHGGAPAELVRSRGLAQVSDEGAIEAAVDAVLAANAAEVERHRSGKKDLTGFFVGQVMKALKGQGHPGVVNALLKKKLGGH
jgi:aspartyl-tRNA(Asn)/glutamyl-tRNA(Gln) amidotransferase subunit B